ncbi:MAG: hypothetical protein KDA99_18185, partial [Planctomycetales bacterium]|nr:hypothetical protein [Planctomycetales bacterium]
WPLLCLWLCAAPAFGGGRLHLEYVNADGQPKCDIRDGDEVWLISTRHLGSRPCTTGNCCERFQFWRYVRCQGWVASDAVDFAATEDPATITTVYVHGNRMEMKYVYDRGFKTYHLMRCGLARDQRLRHVIWAWPSEPVPGTFLKDARAKAERIPVQSYFLACWLARINPDQRVSIMGYSYGARLVMGAMHLLGGGTLDGRKLGPPPNGTFVAPRVVIWAAAMANHWPEPGDVNGQALCAVDHLLLLYNTTDPVLRRYPRLEPSDHCPALGYTGMTRRTLLTDCDHKVCQFNAARYVGRHHDWQRYADSNYLMARIRYYALWFPLQTDEHQITGLTVESASTISFPTNTGLPDSGSVEDEVESTSEEYMPELPGHPSGDWQPMSIDAAAELPQP